MTALGKNWHPEVCLLPLHYVFFLMWQLTYLILFLLFFSTSFAPSARKPLVARRSTNSKGNLIVNLTTMKSLEPAVVVVAAQLLDAVIRFSYFS